MNRRTLIAASLCLGYCAAHADNIRFADRAVKALCVQNWDRDGDGELSTEEAAAVTTLGSVFKSSSYGTVFPELRYFTGLTKIDDYAFYKSSIQQVEFPSTVTAIGEYAFSESNISGELRVPGSVKEIKNYAFYSCNRLTSVVLEEGVESVGWHSLSGPISSLVLPSSLVFMKSMAIDPFVSNGTSSGVFLPEGDLWVYAKADTPASIDFFAFYFVFGYGHLVVSSDDAVEAYKAHDSWSQFGQYVSKGDVNADGLIDDEDADLLNDYLAGEDVTLKNIYLADINWDGRVDDDDLTALQDILDGHEGVITGVQAVDAQRTPASSSAVYSLDGRMVAQDDSALDALPKGVYIYRGRKIAVKK